MKYFSFKDGAVILVGVLITLLIFVLFVDWSQLFLCLEEGSACYPIPGVNSLVDIYDDKLRSDFFSGFLAVGAFLLSLKTFIVMTMKTSVYDTEEYGHNWSEKYALDSRVGSRYRGLKELNDCMFNSILFSLFAAVAQVTIGIVSGFVFVFLSLLLCVISILYLAYCLLLVKRNLDSIIPD